MKTFAEKNWHDCSKAIAYCLNFVQISYLKGEQDNYYEVDCPTCGSLGRQKTDFISSKTEMSKKDYYQLSNGGMGVSEKLYRDMLEYGVSPDCFRPIRSRKQTTLGYQITPMKRLPALPEENAWIISSKCPQCHRNKYEVAEESNAFLAYSGCGYPIYLGKVLLSDDLVLLDGFDDILISLELYNYLVERYPRIECRPVFSGTIEIDPEYIRLTKAHRHWNDFERNLDILIESGKEEERSSAVVQKAILQMCFPKKASYDVEPTLRKYFTQYPSLHAAMIGSYFSSIFNYSREDIYYLSIESYDEAVSSKEKARLQYIKALHLYKNEEIDLNQVKALFKEAKMTGETCDAFSQFIEYIEKEKVSFPDSQKIWEYEDSEKPLEQLTDLEYFMQYFMD